MRALSQHGHSESPFESCATVAYHARHPMARSGLLSAAFRGASSQ